MYFISPQTEMTKFVTDLLVDFSVGPVQGPQRHGAVHHGLTRRSRQRSRPSILSAPHRLPEEDSRPRQYV